MTEIRKQGYLWRIELLGGLRAVRADQVITRFRSQKTGALLAYLAFHGHRLHPRGSLIELLWPESEPSTGRMRLRTALSSLRRQFEPPGVPSGAVIVADRQKVGLKAASVVTDVAEFEAAQRAERLPAGRERAAGLTAAFNLYQGPLLPGYFEPWIVPEQQRLAGQFWEVARELIGCREHAGDLAGALEVAGRAVAADPFNEAAHRELTRLTVTAGKPVDAPDHPSDLEPMLHNGRDTCPSESLRIFNGRLGHGDAQTTYSRSPAAALPSRVAPSPSDAEENPRGLLPPTVTRFFGREAEIARLRRLLGADGTRLVTLAGTGGSGKTRLALEVATPLCEALDGAVWFVPLADVTDPARIIDAIHAALRLPRRPDIEPADQVVRALSRRPCLLVLDNFEQLMPDGAAVVRGLLLQVPLLQCLVTSRLVLGLDPEREVAVGPLPVPWASARAAQDKRADVRSAWSDSRCAAMSNRLNDLAGIASVALFVDRAQSVLPQFQITTRNADALAAICRRLEGIPLALELAAARVWLLSPGKMLMQLEKRFDLLVSHRRDLPPRHQTLRAAVDWSYRLLPPEQQRFIARLSVFRGGWNEDAAAVVAATCPERKESVQALLGALRDNSFLQAEQSGGESRYRLLETLREFAAEQLSAEDQAQVAERHASFYLELAEAADRALRHGPQQKEALDRLEMDHDNLTAALDWCVTQQKAEMGLRLALTASDFWRARGYLSEARRWLGRAAELPPAPGIALDVLRARALTEAMSFATRQSDFGAARALGEAARMAWRGTGDQGGMGALLLAFGTLAGEEGDQKGPARYAREALQHFLAAGDRRGTAIAMNNLGYSLILGEQYEEASGWLRQALVLNQSRHDRLRAAANQNNLGLALVRQGQVDEAESLFQASLRSRYDLCNIDGFYYSLDGLAEVAAARGQWDRVARLIGASDLLRAAIGHPRVPPVAQTLVDRLLDAARRKLGADRFDAALLEGQSWSLDQAVAYALGTAVY